MTTTTTTQNTVSETVVDISSLLDKPIAFHRCYATLAGSAAGGLFLSQLVYWDGVIRKKKKYQDRDGWFFKSQEEWAEETMLTRREQETARKTLKKLDILEESRKGQPARLWFRLNREQLNRALLALITPEPEPESDPEPEKLPKSDNPAAAPVESQFVTSDNLECHSPECHILQTGMSDVTNIQRLLTETTSVSSEDVDLDLEKKQFFAHFCHFWADSGMTPEDLKPEIDSYFKFCGQRNAQPSVSGLRNRLDKLITDRIESLQTRNLKLARGRIKEEQAEALDTRAMALHLNNRI